MVLVRRILFAGIILLPSLCRWLGSSKLLKFALLEWKRIQPVTDWNELSDGCYLLRTNVTDWSDEDLWKAYIQLAEAEAVLRIQKSDLSIRPIWHQEED